MPIRRTLLAPPLHKQTGRAGVMGEGIVYDLALDDIPGYTLEVRIIHEGGRTKPSGAIVLRGPTPAIRFSARGSCALHANECGVVKSFDVYLNAAPRLHSTAFEPFSYYTSSPARMEELLDLWLDAVLVPVPATAPGGIDAARRVLESVAALPPAGWTLSSFVVYDVKTIRTHEMRGRPGAMAKGDEAFVRTAERVAELLRIDLGFQPQADGILVPVTHGEIEVEAGAQSAHQRIAAVACLQEWAAGGGKDRRTRTAVVERILKNAGVSAPAGAN